MKNQDLGALPSVSLSFFLYLSLMPIHKYIEFLQQNL